jgi:hypothetical protein
MKLCTVYTVVGSKNAFVKLFDLWLTISQLEHLSKETSFEILGRWESKTRHPKGHMEGKCGDAFRVNNKHYVTDGNIMYLTGASRFLISCVIQHYAPVVGWRNRCIMLIMSLYPSWRQTLRLPPPGIEPGSPASQHIKFIGSRPKMTFMKCNV